MDNEQEHQRQRRQQQHGQQHDPQGHEHHGRRIVSEGDVEAEGRYNNNIVRSNDNNNIVVADVVPPPPNSSAASTLMVDEEIIDDGEVKQEEEEDENDYIDNVARSSIDPTIIKGDIVIPVAGGAAAGGGTADEGRVLNGRSSCSSSSIERNPPPLGDGDIDTMQTPSSLYSLSTRQAAAPPLNYQLNQGKQSKNRGTNNVGRGGGAGGYFEGGEIGDGSFGSHRQQQERATRPGAFTVRGIATGDIPAWAWRRTTRRDGHTDHDYDDDVAMTRAIQESYRQQRERLRQEKTQKLWKGRMLGFLLVCLVAGFVIGVSMLVADKQNQQQSRSSDDEQSSMTSSGDNEDDGINDDALPDVPFVYYDDDIVESRWASIRDSVEYFTHFPRSIDNPLSPQRKALDWLVYVDKANVDVTDIDRLATRYGLAVLYFGTNGFQWNNKYQFLSPLHECNWTSSYNTSTTTTNSNTTTDTLAGSTTRSTTSSWMVDTTLQQGVICNSRDQIDALFLGTNVPSLLLFYVCKAFAFRISCP